jgi:hypothetical protein
VSTSRRNALYYLLGTLVGRASGLVLIPLYLLVLTPAEAGSWATLSILRTVVAALATGCLDGWLTQEYWRKPADERDRWANGIIGLIFRWNLVLALPTFLALAWEPAQLAAITILGAQATGIVTLLLSYRRIEERAAAHCLLVCLSGGGASLLATVLALTGWGIPGLALGFALPPLIVATAVVRPGTTWRDPDAWQYARTVFLGRAVGEIASHSDRLLLAVLLSNHLLGLYDLAARIAGVLNLLLSSVKSAVLPTVLRHLADGTPATDAWQTWRQALLLACGGAVLAAIMGVGAAALWPAHPWVGAVFFLPGALAIPLATQMGLSNAAAVYHHRLTVVQAWLPFMLWAATMAGGGIAAVMSPVLVPWGIAGAWIAQALGMHHWLHRRGQAEFTLKVETRYVLPTALALALLGGLAQFLCHPA